MYSSEHQRPMSSAYRALWIFPWELCDDVVHINKEERRAEDTSLWHSLSTSFVYCAHRWPVLGPSCCSSTLISTRTCSHLYHSCEVFRPAYLYRFSRDIPILALNHDFPISCGGVPILEDAGIFSARRFPLVLFRWYSRILPASCTYRQSRRCVAAINSPRNAMNQC